MHKQRETTYSPWISSFENTLGVITWCNCFLHNFISVSHCFGEFWSTLLHYIVSVAPVSPQHLSQFGLWTLTGPLQRLFFFSHSVVGLLLCWGSLSHCMTQIIPTEPWGEFAGTFTPVRLAAVLNFFHLSIIFCTVKLWTSGYLQMAF